MNKTTCKIIFTPCDGEDGFCPYDAQSGDACRRFCGLGVDENSYEEDYIEDEEED